MNHVVGSNIKWSIFSWNLLSDFSFDNLKCIYFIYPKANELLNNGIKTKTTILFKCFHDYCSRVINPSLANNLLQTYHYWDANPIAHNVYMNGNLVPIINNGYFITSKSYISLKNDCRYILMFHLLMHEFCNFSTNRVKLMHVRVV
jgi:hypothetical protein